VKNSSKPQTYYKTIHSNLKISHYFDMNHLRLIENNSVVQIKSTCKILSHKNTTQEIKTCFCHQSSIHFSPKISFRKIEQYFILKTLYIPMPACLQKKSCLVLHKRKFLKKCFPISHHNLIRNLHSTPFFINYCPCTITYL
jgi:hypothetical protein